MSNSRMLCWLCSLCFPHERHRAPSLQQWKRDGERESDRGRLWECGTVRRGEQRSKAGECADCTSGAHLGEVNLMKWDSLSAVCFLGWLFPHSFFFPSLTPSLSNLRCAFIHPPHRWVITGSGEGRLIFSLFITGAETWHSSSSPSRPCCYSGTISFPAITVHWLQIGEMGIHLS